MKANEIKEGGHYLAKISNRIVTVRVDSIEEGETRRLDQYSGLWKYGSRTIYNVINLATGRKTTFKSAQKFRRPVIENIVLKPGVRLMIYKDPITRKSPEGMATLIDLIREDGRFADWMVQFDDDARDGSSYPRRIELLAGMQVNI